MYRLAYGGGQVSESFKTLAQAREAYRQQVEFNRRHNQPYTGYLTIQRYEGDGEWSTINKTSRDPIRQSKKIKHQSTSFALDEALSKREMTLFKAANAAAYGERLNILEPNAPNKVEQHYMNAIEAFYQRRPTRGYDEIDRGNHVALLRLGRSRRRDPQTRSKARWSYFAEDLQTGQRWSEMSKTTVKSLAKVASLKTGHVVAVVAIDNSNNELHPQGAYYGRTWRDGAYTYAPWKIKP